MDEQVADLVALLGGRPAVVFGHSYGGNVALAVAARRPDLVRAVAVYETPLSWLDWWPSTTAGADALAAGADPADAAERFMRRLIGDERWQRLPPGTRRARRDEGAAMVGELRDLQANAPWEPDAVTVPAVAIHGTRGAAHHGASTAHLGQVLPDCPVVEIEGAKHFGPNTHPDAVAAVARRAGQPSGDVTVTSRPKNVHVVSSTAPAASVAPTRRRSPAARRAAPTRRRRPPPARPG